MAPPRNELIYGGFGGHPTSPRPDVGGFVTGTRMVIESPRFDHTRFHFSAYTHPGDGSLAARFLEDCRRLRATLRAAPQARIVMLQVGYYRSIYREFALAWLARRAGRRVLLDIRGGAVLDFLDRGSNAIQRALFRRLVESADLVLVQCSAHIPELQRRHPRARFEWFPNFVPAARCQPRVGAPFTAGEPLRCVYFGNYPRAKGVPEIVEAITRLRREQGLDVELHLAGEGRDPEIRQRVAEAAAAGVHDHGMLDRDQLWSLLQRMHVFLFPTSPFGEGHSNSLNEALMSGLAVVATPHNQNPFVLPQHDALWLEPTRLVRERFTDERWIPFLEGCFDRLDTAARELR